MLADRCQQRRGFTILEVSLVGCLTGLLAVLLLQTWAAYDHAAAEIAARCDLAQEADLVITSLASDLAATDDTPGPLVGLRYSRNPLSQGIMRISFELCFDAGDQPNGLADWDSSGDAVIAYVLDRLDPGQEVPDGEPAPVTLGQLRRQYGGEERTIAYGVDNLRVRTLLQPFVQIDLTFRHRTPGLVRGWNPTAERKERGDLLRTYTLIATLP